MGARRPGCLGGAETECCIPGLWLGGDGKPKGRGAA